jgi:hypothetical protein
MNLVRAIPPPRRTDGERLESNSATENVKYRPQSLQRQNGSCDDVWGNLEEA